eukprot:TRINITY_DN324_c2_g1_i2.p1 TRINITY_DN324_c2_g1~~TRINITY_DN324_c2_g1_i2.p1  ORF type:complete len:437 (+),score=151.97 TRINITY_DN324_c2_g1_i2:866-2176(+)
MSAKGKKGGAAKNKNNNKKPNPNTNNNEKKQQNEKKNEKTNNAVEKKDNQNKNNNNINDNNNNNNAEGGANNERREKQKKQKPKKLQTQLTVQRNLTIRPIVLSGHERPVTQTKFNNDSDLLFTASKDGTVSVWYTDNGERLGSYQGKGAVSSIDITTDSELLLMGATDEVNLWRVSNGDLLYTWKIPGRIVSVELNYGNNQFLVGFNVGTAQNPRIYVYNLSHTQPGLQPKQTAQEIILKVEGSLSKCAWGYMNENIISVTSKGGLYVHDLNGNLVREPIHDHTRNINNIAFSHDRLYFLTCSDDNTARLYNAKTFTLLRTYETHYPVLSGAFSKDLDHIITSGGLPADVTTTSGGDLGQFATRFFSLMDEGELASIRAHFGPVNSVAFSPNGKIFSSGGEEGVARLYHLPEDYFKGALEEAAEVDLAAELALQL